MGSAADLQINRLNQRAKVRKRSSLKARPRCFKAITDFDSRDWQKTNPTPNRLVVVVIRVAVKIKCARGTRIKGIKDRPVGNIEGVIRASRADGKSSAHLGAD